MAKGKSGKPKSKDSKTASKKRGDGSVDITKAEKRLAKALAGVDAAREKVLRRERALAKQLERHGRTVPVGPAAGEVIPLEATSQTTSENGATDHVLEPAETDHADNPIELSASADSNEHDY